MDATRLNRAVERLLTDRRFLRRFRRNPERALRSFDLSRREVAALKRGRAEELLSLGLDSAYVAPPEPAGRAAIQAWLLRNAGRLVPATLLAAAALAFAPAAGEATKGRTGRRRAFVRLLSVRARHTTGLRRADIRASIRAQTGLRRAHGRVGLSGIGRALRRVGTNLQEE